MIFGIYLYNNVSSYCCVTQAAPLMRKEKGKKLKKKVGSL